MSRETQSRVLHLVYSIRSTLIGSQRLWLAPIAAVEYPEATFPFASNHGLGMAIAQLDLTHWMRVRVSEFTGTSVICPPSGTSSCNFAGKSECLSIRSSGNVGVSSRSKRIK